MTDELRLAWAYLSRVAEPPSAELAALVTLVGAVEAADRVRRGRAGDAVWSDVEARREIDCAKADLETLDRLGGRLVSADDDEWPLLAFTAFRGVADRARADAPMVLWAVGPAMLDEVASRAAALVGTRAATAYGEHVAGDLAAGLVHRDVAVVSGGAYGVDGAAHRAALAGDGVTVAVLAGGIDVPYPAGHTAMLRRIAERGLVLSEYPPGVRPARHRFLTRNRLVAALAGATVVVEAGARSGAANTAAWARALGRPVCAVPGPVTSSASTGCHALLRGGAYVVTRAEEVVELVGRAGEFAPEEVRPASPLDDLTDEDKRVYDALPRRGGRTAEQIAVASGLPERQVLGPLANLELLGLVVCAEGRWKLAPGPRQRVN
ncbi:DNA-processing protein DprA [Mycobacterium sp. IDR2000157661]|uniref:DNA-processing protein DprA n=1 Tax=Mycobacterium sp. IDR2000157661 TaxID=2867005 RepID=UPI001EEDA224|nr:DNA-processing protein DprA [Mycobacterium sp. IDR2000157661]ULE35938.1 DNA-processing protein DprA [Mycobacterium sp. IDR2000157661]